MMFKTISDELESYVSKGVSRSTRRLVVIGAEDDFKEQLCEISLPPEHEPVGAGVLLNVHLREVSSIFGGKPRLRVDILSIGGLAGAAPSDDLGF